MDNNLPNQTTITNPNVINPNIIVKTNKQNENMMTSTDFNKYNETTTCKPLDLDLVLNIILGLFIIYLIYLFLFSCQTNNYEYMENPENNYILEQNMYKKLSEKERKDYINMNIDDKMKFFNNHI